MHAQAVNTVLFIVLWEVTYAHVLIEGGILTSALTQCTMYEHAHIVCLVMCLGCMRFKNVYLFGMWV